MRSVIVVHPSAVIYPNVALGDGATVEPHVVLGSLNGRPLVVGRNAVIRSGTRIYGGVTIGDGFQTGHYALVRGDVTVGHGCRLGSYSSIEGTVTVGDGTVIRGRCEIPNSTVGKRVQVYAGTMFYDTRKPPDGPNLPPVIEDDVVLCCNVSVLGGVTVGAGSMVAANTFVTDNIPPGSFVKRDGTWVPRRS